MGVRFPLPAPSNLFVCNMLQGREVSEAGPSSTNTVHCASSLFSILYGFRSMAWGQPSIYRLSLHIQVSTLLVCSSGGCGHVELFPPFRRFVRSSPVLIQLNDPFSGLRQSELAVSGDGVFPLQHPFITRE